MNAAHFGQLISLIDNRLIAEATTASKSDRYVKRFTTKDHLISMPRSPKPTTHRSISSKYSSKHSKWHECSAVGCAAVGLFLQAVPARKVNGTSAI